MLNPIGFVCVLTVIGLVMSGVIFSLLIKDEGG
jgi:hypothetical protein